jgi:hypothetical protein
MREKNEMVVVIAKDDVNNKETSKMARPPHNSGYNALAGRHVPLDPVQSEVNA